MMYKVLAAFPYSEDGRFTKSLAVDDLVEIREDLVEGLAHAGLIGEATEEDLAAAAGGAVVIAAPVDIPDHWRDLHWFQYRKIAVALNGGQPVGSKSAAVAIIEAEQARRAELA